MKKITLLLICLSVLFSCSKDNEENFEEDNSLCLCEQYFNEFYNDYLIPSYQIKTITIKDFNDPIDNKKQLLLTVTYYNEVPMSKVTTTVHDIWYKYGDVSNDKIGQWQSGGEKGLEIVCNHLNKRNVFNRYIIF